MSSINLNGRTILISGGARGLGAAFAQACASAGARLVLGDIRDDLVQETASQLRSDGFDVHGRTVDISDPTSVAALAADLRSEFGSIDGLINNAALATGIGGKDFESIDIETWDRVMAINVRGTFLAVQAAVKQLRSTAQGGSIVLYTSTAGQRGSAVYSAYATSKGAQILFMRSMAMELASDRIRVNCIAPAWTETEMATEKIDAIGRASVVSGFPLGRIGLPNDIAGATCFLLSDLAGFITGATLTVDGGMDMRG